MVVSRVMEAIASFLPVGSALLGIIVLGSYFHMNHLFHWMDADLIDPNSPKYDIFMANKAQLWLSPNFWLVRCVIYLVIFALCSAAFAWDFVMSLDPHWFSSLFMWYGMVSYEHKRVNNSFKNILRFNFVLTPSDFAVGIMNLTSPRWLRPNWRLPHEHRTSQPRRQDHHRGTRREAQRSHRGVEQRKRPAGSWSQGGTHHDGRRRSSSHLR